MWGTFKLTSSVAMGQPAGSEGIQEMTHTDHTTELVADSNNDDVIQIMNNDNPIDNDIPINLDSNPEHIDIQINFNKLNSQSLYIDAIIEGYTDNIFDCLVDNGACVSLIKASVVDTLPDIEKHPSIIHTISGIGHAAIKITHYVTLNLRFCSGFLTGCDEFYIVPSKFMEDSLVLGVPLLRSNNLLPDMSTYQLLQRGDNNSYKIVASDPTKNTNNIRVLADENVELGAMQCRFIPINLCNCSYSLETFSIEGLNEK